MSASSEPMTQTGGTADGCMSPDEPLGAGAIPRVFRQFVADVECATHFPNVEHLYTQSLFLGGATSVPQSLDMLLRLESLPADVARLKRAVNYTGADHCPLKTERAARDKPRAVPRASILRDLLRMDRALLQSVCNVFMQDFICLGYELPEGCELLPRAAARAPTTMGITPAELRA